MPEVQEAKGVEQPPFDPDKLLRQLEELIKSKSTPAGHGDRVGSSWIWSIIIPIIVLIGIAVFAWISRKNGRELAKLRHEKVKAKVLADNAKVSAELEQNAEHIARAQKNSDMRDEKLRRIEADIRAEEARHEADRRAIDRMRTWDGSYRRGI